MRKDNPALIERRREHIDYGWMKKLIGVLIATIGAHFLAGIWWAATITANVSFLRESITSINSELTLQKNDSLKVVQLAKEVVTDTTNKLEERLTFIEHKISGEKEVYR